MNERHWMALAENQDLGDLMRQAAAKRDRHYGRLVTYSRKLFLPLTQLCRDVCHYCTFAKPPRALPAPYMAPDEAVRRAGDAARLGCKEALLTLGDQPERRYRVAREALDAMGFATTLEYVGHVAGRILAETGVLPHINAGVMNAADFARLRPVSASMGLMLESASPRLCEAGMPHHGSPDKAPAVRLASIAAAGAAQVPFTSGILIGIGETRTEIIESLLALRDLHQRHGHVQEIIVQNFRAKPGTRMADAPEPGLDDLLWAIAVARLVMPAEVSVQAPPNLSPGALPALIAAGINDWGGVSPVTPDFVNPEAPWPHLEKLAAQTAKAGKHLCQRLTIYPGFAQQAEIWTDAKVRPHVLALAQADGLAREDDWAPGRLGEPPAEQDMVLATRPPAVVTGQLRRMLDQAQAGRRLAAADIAQLFSARGDDCAAILQAADALRQDRCGDQVSYVVNRNINYTNVCGYRCRFCAFSKGRMSENLRGRPYDLEPGEIARRVREAWQRGATEVCLQGGIHPAYTGQTYLDILAIVKQAAPDIHVHAFSPLEVSHGAASLGLPLTEFLAMLKAAGLASLPGTAAEILDDEVRTVLCPDKINTQQWLEVMRSAHRLGLRTTATIMFGHVDRPIHWARHLLRVRDLQAETGGFTEFVPLPFVAQEAPIYLKGGARPGPSFRETLLMHALARLVLNPLIQNIQVSWVKMGEAGVAAALNAGVNDLGGTLMNESISRAAGAAHGQEWPPEKMDAFIRAAGRQPLQRTTLYGSPPPARRAAGYGAAPLTDLVLTAPSRPAPAAALVPKYGKIALVF